MSQVRTYRDALNAVEDYVDSAKECMSNALGIAKEIEKADTADRDDISTLIHYIEAAIEGLKE